MFNGGKTVSPHYRCGYFPFKNDCHHKLDAGLEPYVFCSGHQVKRRFPDGESVYPMLKAFRDRGVDTIMGILQQEQIMQDAMNIAQEHTGKKMIVIHTPILNVDDNDAARKA